jgi:hypothetical protein
VDINSISWKEGDVREASMPQTPGGSGPHFSLNQGKAEVEVVDGQPLRVVTPLLMAAVRGTHFIVTVAADGTSSFTTIEGQVFAVTRTGVAQMTTAGGGMQMSASGYAALSPGKRRERPRSGL